MVQMRQRQCLAEIYSDDLKAQKDFQIEHVTLLHNFFLAIVRVCDHFNTVSDKHEKCYAYFL